MEFDMKDLGVVNQILRIKVIKERKDKKNWLSQKHYMEKILQCFNKQNDKPDISQAVRVIS